MPSGENASPSRPCSFPELPTIEVMSSTGAGSSLPLRIGADAPGLLDDVERRRRPGGSRARSGRSRSASWRELDVDRVEVGEVVVVVGPAASTSSRSGAWWSSGRRAARVVAARAPGDAQTGRRRRRRARARDGCACRRPYRAGPRRRRRVRCACVKYVVLVPDGCADEPVDELDGRTPLEAAALPHLARARGPQRGRPGDRDPRRAAAGQRRREPRDPRLRPARVPHRPRADRGRGDGRGARGPTRSRTAATSSPSAPTARWSTSPPVTSRASRATRSSRRSTPTLGGGRDGVRFHAGRRVPPPGRGAARLGRRRVRAAARPHRQARGLADRRRRAAKLAALMEASRPVVAERRGRVDSIATQIWLWGQGVRPTLPPLRRPLRRRRPADLRGRPRARARRARRHRGARRPRRERRLRQRLRRAARRVPRRRSPTATSSSSTSRRPTKRATSRTSAEKVAALEAWDREIIGPLVDALPGLRRRTGSCCCPTTRRRSGSAPTRRTRCRTSSSTRASRSRGGRTPSTATAGLAPVAAHGLMAPPDDSPGASSRDRATDGRIESASGPDGGCRVPLDHRVSAWGPDPESVAATASATPGSLDFRAQIACGSSPYASSDWTPGSGFDAGRTGRFQGADDGLRAATRTVDARRQGSRGAARDRRRDGRQGHHPAAQGRPRRRDPRRRGRPGRAAVGQRARRAATKDTANGSADAKPKRAVRSKKASELAARDASIAALAAEEDGARGRPAPSPRSRPDPAAPRRATETDDADAATPAPRPTTGERRPRDRRRGRGRASTPTTSARRTATATAPARRRRRRRGRDRGRAPGRRASARRRWRAARARVQRRADRDRGSARPARRGLRLPPHERLPARSQRRVRVRVAGAPLRAAQGRLRQGRDPSAGEQREVPGAAARRPDQRRRDPTTRARAPALRGPHPAVPGRAAPARARSRSPASSPAGSSTCCRRSARASAG